MAKQILLVFSIILLIYLLLPGPDSINDFPPLQSSAKSTLEGDTIQVPNVAGYFSANYRDFSTNFYRQAYQKNTWFPFPPLKLNHPPEFAFTAIKDQTHSTYLEEYYYPLRDSFFINGEEPFYQDGRAKFRSSTLFEQDDKLYETKVVVKFYPSSIFARIIVWGGICLSSVLLWKLSRRIIFNA